MATATLYPPSTSCTCKYWLVAPLNNSTSVRSSEVPDTQMIAIHNRSIITACVISYNQNTIIICVCVAVGAHTT